MPDGPEMNGEIELYWRFLASRDCPSTSDKPGSGCIPLYLWGDDCQFNERGQKMCTIVCGHVLDTRKNSKLTVYPLFVYQVEPWMQRALQCRLV